MKPTALSLIYYRPVDRFVAGSGTIIRWSRLTKDHLNQFFLACMTSTPASNFLIFGNLISRRITQRLHYHVKQKQIHGCFNTENNLNLKQRYHELTTIKVVAKKVWPKTTLFSKAYLNFWPKAKCKEGLVVALLNSLDIFVVEKT
jgi:hypothetical protein